MLKKYSNYSQEVPDIPLKQDEDQASDLAPPSLDRTVELTSLFLGLRKSLLLDSHIEPASTMPKKVPMTCVKEGGRNSLDMESNSAYSKEDLNQLAKSLNFGINRESYEYNQDTAGQTNLRSFSPQILERSKRVKLMFSLFYWNLERNLEIHMPLENNPNKSQLPGIDGVFNPLQTIRNRSIRRKQHYKIQDLGFKALPLPSQAFSRKGKKHKSGNKSTRYFKWEIPLKELIIDMNWKLENWHLLIDPSGELWFEHSELPDGRLHHRLHYKRPHLRNHKRYKQLFEDYKEDLDDDLADPFNLSLDKVHTNGSVSMLTTGSYDDSDSIRTTRTNDELKKKTSELEKSASDTASSYMPSRLAKMPGRFFKKKQQPNVAVANATYPDTSPSFDSESTHQPEPYYAELPKVVIEEASIGDEAPRSDFGSYSWNRTKFEPLKVGSEEDLQTSSSTSMIERHFTNVDEKKDSTVSLEQHFSSDSLPRRTSLVDDQEEQILKTCYQRLRKMDILIVLGEVHMSHKASSLTQFIQTRADQLQEKTVNLNTSFCRLENVELKEYDDKFHPIYQKAIEYRNFVDNDYFSKLDQMMALSDRMIGEINTSVTLDIRKLNDRIDKLNQSTSLMATKSRFDLRKIGYKLLENLIVLLFWLIWVIVSAYRIVKIVLIMGIRFISWVLSD
ncbi:hypothetical protein LJB42_003798 [Komagataella kurtzmanii]|nr:hypothetical protein LJB42_003798 [Komagataella kurtzmanii]